MYQSGYGNVRSVSIRSGSLADSVSTRTVSSPTSYRFAPLPPLPAHPAPAFAAVDTVHYRIYTPTAASRPDPFVAAEGLPNRTISVEESPKARLSPSSPSAPSSVSSRTSPSGTRRLSRLLGSLPSPLRSVSVRNGKLVRPPPSCTASRITTNRTPYDSYPSSPSPPSPYQSITSTISLPSSTPDSASITSTSGTQIYASMYDSADERRRSADNPLAVVFLKELSVEERKARPEVEDFASREIPLDRYVYYRLYNRDGETAHPPHSTPGTQRIWKYADLYEGTAPRDPLGGSSSIGREMGMGRDVNSPLLLTRKYRQSEKLTYDILQGTMMQTDGVVKDSMCECVWCRVGGEGDVEA
ncbi:hypothetical protein B0H13DRAFT_2072471, partial [Mycena leptocephala]